MAESADHSRIPLSERENQESLHDDNDLNMGTFDGFEHGLGRIGFNFRKMAFVERLQDWWDEISMNLSVFKSLSLRILLFMFLTMCITLIWFLQPFF